VAKLVLWLAGVQALGLLLFHWSHKDRGQASINDIKLFFAGSREEQVEIEKHSRLGVLVLPGSEV
jgi:hypothetical protein